MKKIFSAFIILVFFTIPTFAWSIYIESIDCNQNHTFVDQVGSVTFSNGDVVTVTSTTD